MILGHLFSESFDCYLCRYLVLFREPKTLNFWSWREELNLQPAVYKTAALPLSYASQT